MHTEIQPAPITVVGIELRTSNDVAHLEIPALWQRFYGEGILEQIPNKVSGDVYAVYTNFEHEGVSNQGVYSCVIGAAVTQPANVPGGLSAVRLPASTYRRIPVPTGRTDLVGEAWQRIWQEDTAGRTFIADFEHYGADGTIAILLGIRD